MFAVQAPRVMVKSCVGEVGGKAFLSIPMPCGALYADFCVRIFVCGFFVRILVCGFSCGFGIFGVRISVRILMRMFFEEFVGRETAGRVTKKIRQKIHPKILPQNSSRIPPRIFARQPSFRLAKSRVHTWVPVAQPNSSVFLFLATLGSGWCRSSRSVLRTSKLRKTVPRQDLKYGKRNTHCKSQSMHMDTSLGPDVFHGWSPLPLQSPEKPQKSQKKILTAAQQIPGGQYNTREFQISTPLIKGGESPPP